MFSISISNMTGISCQQKLFKVGVREPVASCCLNLSADTTETFNWS